MTQLYRVPTLQELCKVLLTPETTFNNRIIALDPGETTGYAIFEGISLKHCSMIKTPTVYEGVKELQPILIKDITLECAIVCEDYRVYGWKAQSHINEELHTPKLIGAIETMCMLRSKDVHKQTAHVAKTFADDAKLRFWGLHQKGMRHANDAIRHALYFYFIHYPRLVKQQSKGRD